MAIQALYVATKLSFFSRNPQHRLMEFVPLSEFNMF